MSEGGHIGQMGANPKGTQHRWRHREGVGGSRRKAKAVLDSFWHEERTMCLDGGRSRTMHTVDPGGVFEALRLMVGRCEPWTVQSKST